MESSSTHPRKVAIVDAPIDGLYANRHPFKVLVVGGHIGFEGRVVDELPEKGETGCIYLVPKEKGQEGDIYSEWVWALQQDDETYGWEHIGATNEVVITLYNELGQHTDGAMTQKSTTDAIATKASTDDLSTVAFSGEYSALQHKPEEFTYEDWEQLWS